MTDELVVHEAQPRSGALPAWSLPKDAEDEIALPTSGPSGSRGSGPGAGRPARA